MWSRRRSGFVYPPSVFGGNSKVLLMSIHGVLGVCTFTVWRQFGDQMDGGGDIIRTLKE